MRPSGFILIEILVALVIITYVGLSAQQRISQFADDRSRLNNKQQAHWVAWNQLMQHYQNAQGWRVQGEPEPERSGNVEALGRQWFYANRRQATITKNFYRFETRVAENPISDADDNNPGTASLTLFLVTQ